MISVASMYHRTSDHPDLLHRTGGALGMMIYIILSTPVYALNGSTNVSPAVRVIVSLLPPTAFSLGNSILTQAEGPRSNGVHWNTLFDAEVSDATARDNGTQPLGVSLGALGGMLLLDTIVMITLAWWLDKVRCVIDVWWLYSKAEDCCTLALEMLKT